MAKLKLGPQVDEKSVKLIIELPTNVHRVCLLTPKFWDEIAPSRSWTPES